MTEFTFTASAECDFCGKWLSSSEEECDSCDGELRRYHFVSVLDVEDVVQVWAINPIRAWAELGEKMDWEKMSVAPYRLYETGFMSVEMGVDVLDEDALRNS